MRKELLVIKLDQGLGLCLFIDLFWVSFIISFFDVLVSLFSHSDNFHFFFNRIISIFIVAVGIFTVCACVVNTFLLIN